MSLRPEICGFDLASFLSLFGSGDSALISAMETEFDRNAARDPTYYTNAFRGTFGEVLRQAVCHGIPFPDLSAESEPHVTLAVLMAAHNQEVLVTDSNHWNMSGFDDAWGELFIPAEQESGFARLIHGRPLFGERFETAWSFYGYLSQNELRYMQSRLRSAAPDGPESELRNQLLNDLKRWCVELLAADKDLWCWWA